MAQEPVLFADTLFANIAYGLPKGAADATQSQVQLIESRQHCVLGCPTASTLCPDNRLLCKQLCLAQLPPLPSILLFGALSSSRKMQGKQLLARQHTQAENHVAHHSTLGR